MKTTPRLRALTTTLALAALVLPLAACSGDDERAVDPAAGESSPTASVTPGTAGSPTLPVGEERTEVGTVLDTGDGPELCLGPVEDTAPPQCSGIPLTGWDWAEHPEHESTRGVRWGDFALTGTWDGETLTVSDAVPSAEYDGPEPTEEPPGTACPEPEGGWAAVDEAATTSPALDETLRRAGQLPGYADSWLDPPQASEPAEQVLNVRVTRDPDGAEEALRETWGGPLCVAEAAYSEDELVELSTELQELPGVLGISAWGDVVHLDVVHDDGSLQRWVDQEHGEDRIRVVPALVPAG